MDTRKQGAKFDWSSLSHEIHKGISELWHEDSCTDFVVEVGTESFRCHKVVLAAVSDYFKAMFSSKMKEADQSKVVINDVHPQSFKTIISMLYPKGRKNPLDKVTENDMFELLKLADRFQMKFLRNICLDYVRRIMTCQNCISWWKRGEEILCDELTNMGRDFIRENFDDLVSDKVLVSLDLDDFLDIIGDEDMHVKRESLVWTVIKDWMYFDKEKRSQYAIDMLRECCLTEIPEDFLLEEIAFDPIVRQSDSASGSIYDMVKYRRHPSIHGHVELKFRECHEKKQVSLLFVSENKDQDSNDRVRISSNAPLKGLVVLKDKLVSISNMESRRIDPRFAGHISCCNHGEFVYVLLGDSRRGCQLWEYNGSSNVWATKRELDTSLMGFTMSCTDGCLFVTGGKTGFQMNAQVWQYNIESDSWIIDGEILAPVENASSVAFNDKLYLFGGELEGKTPANSVQVYNTITKDATILCSMVRPCSWSRAILRGETAFVITKDGDVVKVNLQTGEASVAVSVPDFRRINYGVILNRNILHIIGGRNLGENSAVTDVDEEASADKSIIGDIFINIDDGEVKTAMTSRFEGLVSRDIFGCVSVVLKPSSLVC